jgi:hypothetical protein
MWQGAPTTAHAAMAQAAGTRVWGRGDDSTAIPARLPHNVRGHFTSGRAGGLTPTLSTVPSRAARASRSRRPRSLEDKRPSLRRDARLHRDLARHQTPPQRVGCINSIGHGLGGDVVLVDEAAEPVVSADRGRRRACPRRRRIPGFWGCEFERPVRSMGVVVLDKLPQNML